VGRQGLLLYHLSLILAHVTPRMGKKAGEGVSRAWPLYPQSVLSKVQSTAKADIPHRSRDPGGKQRQP
jgi:hypothetical protein